MEIPQTLTAGDLWTWTDSLTSYPAPTWVLSYHFSGKEKKFSLAASASGADHVVSSAIAATSEVPRGAYDWIARVVNGATATTVGSGRLTVEPNLANLAGDHRSFNRRCLDDLEAMISNRAKFRGDALSYSVGGRSQSFASWDEVHAALDRYRYAAAKELGLHAGKILLRTGRA